MKRSHLAVFHLIVSSCFSELKIVCRDDKTVSAAIFAGQSVSVTSRSRPACVAEDTLQANPFLLFIEKEQINMAASWGTQFLSSNNNNNDKNNNNANANNKNKDSKRFTTKRNTCNAQRSLYKSMVYKQASEVLQWQDCW